MLELLFIHIPSELQDMGTFLSYGMVIFGNLAIIRYGAIIDNPLNLLYISIAITVGIFFGVQGFAISVAATLIFCLVLLLTDKSLAPQNFREEMSISLEIIEPKVEEIESLLSKFCKSFNIETSDIDVNSSLVLQEWETKNRSEALGPNSHFSGLTEKIKYFILMYDQSKIGDLLKEMEELKNVNAAQINFNVPKHSFS